MVFPIERVTDERFWMRSAAILLLLVVISPFAHGQSFAFRVDLSVAGTLRFTNISGTDIALLDFEIVSPEEFLIPIPPGDLRGDAEPFTFLLSNNPRQVTFGSLAKFHTIAAGDSWSTRVGYDLTAARAAGDVLQASWGADPLAARICGLTAEACPEPASGLLAVLAGFGGLAAIRNR